MEKRRGRPPLDADEASVPVHLTVTARMYDDAYRRAQAARVSVPEILRRDLAATTDQGIKKTKNR